MSCLFRGGIGHNIRMELTERISENLAKIMRIERAVAQEVWLSRSTMEAA